MTRADPQQQALDELGHRLRWERGEFRSWRVNGYTVSLGSHGRPRKIIAVRGDERREFRTVRDLELGLVWLRVTGQMTASR